MTQRRLPAKHNPFASANVVGGVGFTVGSQASTTINVALQLKNANGKALGVRGSVDAYLSTDAEGDDIVGTAPSGGVAIGTDGVAIPLVANKLLKLVSEADGAIDLNIISNAARTVYLIVVLPDGGLVASGAITFV